MGNIDTVVRYRDKKEHLLIGMMSGTSLDGIDTALVQISTDDSGSISDVQLKHFDYYPYTEELRQRILTISSNESAKLDEIVLAHYGLADWYGFAINKVLNDSGYRAEQIEAICNHGQTIWHAPAPQPFPGPAGELKVRSTLQIGSLSALAERTGIPVIGDFRARDIAAGGEGAPLVPYVDEVLFRHGKEGRILQNIGGIANATVLPPRGLRQEIIAYDTGPGNMVMDMLVQLYTGGQKYFDEQGQLAAAGKVNDDLLQLYLKDSYYKRKPPKSTGREMYTKAFIQQFLNHGLQRKLPFEDIMATATALTSKTITQSYTDFILPHYEISEVIVSGGGTRNKALMDMLRKDLPASITLSQAADHGIPDDAKEAVAFAILGHETLMGRPSNVPEVTGASRPVILGNICY